jgi:hypothetical protein
VRVQLNRWMPREPDIPVVLAGDLNDEPTAVTTALLCGPEDGNPNRPDLGDLVGITEDVDSRRDAVRPDHAPLWARVNWP